MLRWRLALGVLFGAALVAWCLLDRWLASSGMAPVGAALWPLALAAAWGGSDELVRLLAKGGYRLNGLLARLGAVSIVAAAPWPVWWGMTEARWWFPLAAYALASAAVIVEAVFRFQPGGRNVERIACGLFCLTYVGVFTAFLWELLWAPGASHFAALGSLICVVKAGDVGAYTVGRLIGRHKMTPALSPGKTWEGAGGAVLFSILAAWGSLAWLAPGAGPAWWAYGLVLGPLGMLGDLAESLLKRDVGAKDSSTWMPGFGGVLDLLDSLLLTAPVAYLFWQFS